jgi:scavenger receptor class B, member 1
MQRAKITKGSELWEALKTKEVPLAYISVYLFNVTNPEQFLSGEDDKLKVEEIGPFTYM